MMDSAALRAATDLLAERHGVSSSAVYLTAAALTAGALIGQSLCSFMFPASNRGNTDEQNDVGELVQDAPEIIEHLDAPFATVLKEAWAASLEGMMNSHYDEQALVRLRHELDELKMQKVLFDITFNDLRSPARYTSAGDRVTDPRKAMARTRVAPQEEIYRGDSRFLSVLLYDGDGQRPAEMSILVNDAYFPGVPVERMLRAVEELVVGVALKNPEPTARPLEFVRGLLCGLSS
ncbi:hypothetical protein ACIO13_26065 [Streptomyces sp. NPDC087425]|uniref:hypothetical protein n=1 Tax=unclassified Streptomyces TaxID=2593676 RepID=UPI003827C018